jgi:hypothetical protein
MLPSNTVFVGKNSLIWGVHLLSKEYYALGKKGNYTKFKRWIGKVNKEGKNIVVFVEETGPQKDRLRKAGRVKTGIFYIANELGIDVLPIFISPDDTVMGIPTKNDKIFHAGKLLRVNNVKKCIEYTQRFFSKGLFAPKSLIVSNS